MLPTRFLNICQRVLSAAAPSVLEEEILGDLEERFHLLEQEKPGSGTRTYFFEVLRLLPFLAAQHLRPANPRTLSAYIVLCLFAFMLAISWEITFVQRQAWPLTAKLIADSLLAGKFLFLLIYASMYAVGAILTYGLCALLSRSIRQILNVELHAFPLGFASMLSLPLLFYLVQPQPLDSVPMRLALLSCLWCGTYLSLRNRCVRQQKVG